MPVSLHLVPLGLVAVAAMRIDGWSDVSLVEQLGDVPLTYVLLGLSALLIEELSPIFGGIAAHEGQLQLVRVIAGVSIGGWLGTLLLYIAGRARWGWIRRKFPSIRAHGTIALRVVSRNALTASFLVRFAFGLRIVLPLACGAARVPALTYALASLVGSVIWSTLFAVVGYAAGEAAVRVVGHLGSAGKVVGALIVTGAVLGFVRWNRRRKAMKAARRQRVLRPRDDVPGSGAQ